MFNANDFFKGLNTPAGYCLIAVVGVMVLSKTVNITINQ